MISCFKNMKENKKLVLLIVAISLIVGGAAGFSSSFVGRWAESSPWFQKLGFWDNFSHQLENISQSFTIEEESATVDVVEKANPAVVSIVIEKEDSARSYNQNIFPFYEFFGLPFEIQTPEPRKDENQKKWQRVGGGSGFVVSKDGLIATNKHVVSDDSAMYTVILADGKEYEAKIIGRDPFLDVALIKIEAENLSVLPLGNSDELKIGQTVIAIGYALAEFGNTVTRGVVSGIGRTVEAGDGMGMSEVIEQAIQTDAAINPGNSGGPLLNLAGQVVGINTAVSREGQSVGFAIPINSVKKTIESVMQNGKITRPWLGVRYLPITEELAEMNKLTVKYGALVSRGESRAELAVIPGSPADKAGIVENDIILEIDGQKLTEEDSLGEIIAKKNAGDEISLKVLRKGDEKTIKIKLEEYPDK